MSFPGFRTVLQIVTKFAGGTRMFDSLDEDKIRKI